MKKIFTFTIVSSMLLLTIVQSCSKKTEDPAPAPTPTPTPTVTYADTNTIVIDGALQELTPIACTPSGGSSNLLTMSATNASNDVLLTITTKGVPTTTTTYNVVIAPPADAASIQLKVKFGLTEEYVATSGTAVVTVQTSPSVGMKAAFKDLSFVKGPNTKKISATMICP